MRYTTHYVIVCASVHNFLTYNVLVFPPVLHYGAHGLFVLGLISYVEAVITNELPMIFVLGEGSLKCVVCTCLTEVVYLSVYSYLKCKLQWQKQ